MVNNEMTAENLRSAFAGESQAYQRYQVWGDRSEKAHAELFSLAKKALDSGRNFEVESFLVCEVCGYTVKAEAPDKCPVYGKEAEKFREFA